MQTFSSILITIASGLDPSAFPFASVTQDPRCLGRALFFFPSYPFFSRLPQPLDRISRQLMPVTVARRSSAGNSARAPLPGTSPEQSAPRQQSWAPPRTCPWRSLTPALTTASTMLLPSSTYSTPATDILLLLCPLF